MSAPPVTPLASTLAGFFKDLKDRTHASYVIVGAALIDNGLREQLLKKMVPLNKTMETRIFDGYGPLSTAASKVDLCFALSIISRETYDDLRNINKIRVKFAHSPNLKSLGDNDVQKLLEQLVGPIAKGADLARVFMSALQKTRADMATHLRRRDGSSPSSSL